MLMEGIYRVWSRCSGSHPNVQIVRRTFRSAPQILVAHKTLADLADEICRAILYLRDNGFRRVLSDKYRCIYRMTLQKMIKSTVVFIASHNVF